MQVRYLGILAAVGLLAAGCPMTGSQTAGAPSTAPAVAAAAVPASVPPGASSAPAATPTPLISSPPLGPGPTGGALADVAAAAGKAVPNKYKIRFTTTQGDFIITLFPETAVQASAKFKALVDQGAYVGNTFHRVIPGFVAQGGDPLSATLPAGDPKIGTGHSGDAVPDDFRNGLKHLPGAVALAHSSLPNSSYSQFYVCLQRLPALDNGYTVFGQVTAGFDAVQRLTATSDATGKPTGKTPDKILRTAVEE
ncbi:MAG: peptidylprolyl isomerase/peptidyl-prolyl cis-trans isomerase [Cyanobacteria bacterium RYN_339]|nr:peptidylprolyl isomerase/peptidyl-prolyl cis-trans isomerase [Cyanobacteria bacterium RYN_339]